MTAPAVVTVAVPWAGGVPSPYRTTEVAGAASEPFDGEEAVTRRPRTCGSRTWADSRSVAEPAAVRTAAFGSATTPGTSNGRRSVSLAVAPPCEISPCGSTRARNVPSPGATPAISK